MIARRVSVTAAAYWLPVAVVNVPTWGQCATVNELDGKQVVREPDVLDALTRPPV